MSLLDLSQWQFAITVMFHMTFPAITVGLSIFLSVLYGMHWKTGNPVYLQMIRFWRRIFAVGFAIGVVAGIVITFEMGLNWGIYAAKTGPITAPSSGWRSSPHSSWKQASSASCSMVTAASDQPRYSPPR